LLGRGQLSVNSRSYSSNILSRIVKTLQQYLHTSYPQVIHKQEKTAFLIYIRYIQTHYLRK